MVGHRARKPAVRFAASRLGRAICERSGRAFPTVTTDASPSIAKARCRPSKIMRGHLEFGTSQGKEARDHDVDDAWIPLCRSRFFLALTAIACRERSGKSSEAKIGADATCIGDCRRSARRAVPPHPDIGCQIPRFGFPASNLSRRLQNASIVGRKVGVSLFRQRVLAGGSLLRRRRVRLPTEDRIQRRATDLRRSSVWRTKDDGAGT